MARRDQTYDKVAQSALIFFENKPRLWEYGLDKTKWPELEAALDGLKDFHVVNALTQWHQTKIANLVDSDSCGQGIVFNLAQWFNDSKAVLLLQGLLQMGVNPDLVAAGNGQWTPSHKCAYWGSVDIARALVLCRPNLALKNMWGDTPAAKARRQNKLDIANLFEEAERNPFPTIAQLAQQEKWWAVRNLCRRTGIVSEQEKFALHDGKDSIGWAIHHKQLGMAEELEYLLNGVPKNEVLEKKLVELMKEELRKSDTEKGAMKKTLTGQREHIEQLQLDQATMKKEVDELKEMLLLSLTKTTEGNEDLKKELTGLKGKQSKLKDDLQAVMGKLDHQSEQLKQMKVDCKEGASLMQKVAEKGQPITHAAGPISASKSIQGNQEDESASVEADKKALEADKKALQDKVDQLQGVLKAQSALLSSFLKADL